MVLLQRGGRDGRGWICRVVARSCSFRQLPRLRRSHRVLSQCSDSVAMGAIADTADAHSKRRLIPEVELCPIFQTRFASAMLPPGTSSRRNEVCSTLLADDFSEWNPSLPVELLEL